jgi:spoIIIJ-associated protein
VVESVEASGRTIEEAVQKALEQLGKSRDEVTVRVLNAGKPGFLGLTGGEEARVLVEVKQRVMADSPVQSEPAGREEGDAAAATPTPGRNARLLQELEQVQELLREFFQHMGCKVNIEVVSTDPLRLNVAGPGADALVGKRGANLRAIQFLFNLMLTKQFGPHDMVVVDIQSYRQRREEQLTGMANRLAELVRENGKPISLEPMPPNERRVIHLALADNPYVTTHSIGEGEGRRVVIEPRTPQTAQPARE